MSFGNIKIRPTDTLYSKWLRRSVGKCERCDKRGEGPERIQGLQCSHFFGRRHESTRFLRENTDCLCWPCHQFFEENPALYSEWKKEKLGEREYKKLMISANSYYKRDDKLQLIIIKELIKELMPFRGIEN